MNDMFNAKQFDDAKKACEHIKKILAELDSPKGMDFQIIHSLNDNQCEEDGGDWNKTSEILLDYLYDLDSTQGFMGYDQEGFWDFMEWDNSDDEGLAQSNAGELFVYAGEGLVVLHNRLAVKEEEYPIVVVKASFWDAHKSSILNLLKFTEENYDYTNKISPAVYIQMFYAG